MSNFRRLISYIYAYEGGEKGKNIGFAKIDIRGAQCRILVNVKMVYVGSNDIGVYLLSPKAELLLGRIFIRNGSGEFRANVNSADIEGSGLGIDDCYGLTIHDVTSTWQCYTTIWDDAVTEAADTAASVTLDEVMETQKTPERKLPEPLELPISAEIEQELEKEEQKLQAVAPWDLERSEAAEEAVIETDETEPDALIPEEEIIPEEQVVPEAEPQMEQDSRVEAESVDTEHCEETGTEPIAELTSGPEDCEKLKELDRLELEEKSRNRLWDHLQKRYAKVLAFDYDKGCEILSIKPQDIGLLPRDIWVYGNNSFLLHGFYNYRHLILAKLNEPEGTPRYLLGVPGHYFSNEKYMASMFGFPHFVLARKQPDEDGRFGYWYTDIRL